MAEDVEEGPNRLSQTGLVLVQALNKMSLAHEQRRHKTMVPSLLSTDIEEDAFEKADTTDSGSADNKEGITKDPELVSFS